MVDILVEGFVEKNMRLCILRSARMRGDLMVENRDRGMERVVRQAKDMKV